MSDYTLKPIDLAADDEGRYAYVFFHDGKIIATDKCILVIQNAKLYGFSEDQIEALHGKMIAAHDFTYMRKLNPKFIQIAMIDDVLHLSNNGQTVEHVRYLDAMHNRPPYKTQLEKYFGIWEKTERIGIHSELIEIAAQITFAETPAFEYHFCGDEKPIFLRGEKMSWEDEMIIVMPWKISNNLNDDTES